MPNEKSSFHNVQVRLEEARPAIELLETDPALSLFEYWVGASAQGWVSVLPQRIDKGVKVAKSLSQKLHTDAFSLRTFSSDAFLYVYFRNGEKHDEFCSSPDGMQRLQEMDEEMASIVLQWEEGEITASEYRERVNEYLANFDGRVDRVKAQIAAEIPGRSAEAAASLIGERVRAEFRGREADKLILDILQKSFPRANAAALLQAGRQAAEPVGGKPFAFQHLAEPAAVERILRSKLPASEQLRRFAEALRIPAALTSFQHALESPGGLTRIG